MKCKQCDTEMLVDKIIEEEDREIFLYKCKNPNCENYGYKEAESNG